ncbi:hypothetical protein Scep_030739 [Stephania cephalantha]|uniref:Pectinesterase n=1 Tax=Stephania cephalantha TaxID=152367 RepID=A0AAP0HDE9_9MAGN
MVIPFKYLKHPVLVSSVTMAFISNKFNISSVFVTIALFLFMLSSSSAVDPALPNATVTPDSICNATRYPKLCKSILPHDKPSNARDYGQFSIRKSLSEARKFLSLIDKNLRHKSKLSKGAIRALEDCRLLAALNLDFLLKAFEKLNSTANKPLLSYETEDVQTLLSAILTNQQTCLDGIKAASSSWSLIKDEIYSPLSNGTKLYSVSLALFTRGWVRGQKKKKREGKKHMVFSNVGHGSKALPLRMSKRNREIFDKLSKRRRVAEVSGSDVVMVSDVVVVSDDGTGDYKNISEAVAAAPTKTNSSTDGYYLIYITAGVYEEYVSIAKNKNNLMMIGDGINQTIITGNRSFVDGWTTFNSATFAVVGEGFVAVDITFRNTAGAIKHQAVAVRNGADLSTFYSCSFEGYQDTLYTHSLRQFYRECDIYGTVDFIFGNAAVVLQNCKIYARLPMPNQFNAITAQGRTDPNQNTGTSIHNCSILATPDLAANRTNNNGTVTRTYLGRPWKEYSRTVYMQSVLGGFIEPTGWSPWSGDFALQTLWYGEYNNTGSGANTSKRVNWPGYHKSMNTSDASNFTVSSFILGDDWISPTGVTYFGGLM